MGSRNVGRIKLRSSGSAMAMTLQAKMVVR
jgi:hypothetical protein